jgi:hypothetical protein
VEGRSLRGKTSKLFSRSGKRLLKKESLKRTLKEYNDEPDFNKIESGKENPH